MSTNLQDEPGKTDAISPSLRPLGENDAEDVNPALHPDVTSVPVTPGVHLGKSAYIEPEDLPTPPVPDINTDNLAAGPGWNANDSFSQPRVAQHGDGRPHSPTEVAAGARTGEELLRRLSLSEAPSTKRDLADFDPRAAHPDLNLSGTIISATFRVPYNIGYAPGADWVGNGTVWVELRY